MYKHFKQFMLVTIAVSMALISCNRSVESDDDNTSSEIGASESDNVEIKCKLQTQTFILAGNQRTFNLTWENDKVSRIDAEIVNQEGVYMEFEYNESNQLIKLTSHFGGRVSLLNYHYEEGELKQIDGDGYLPRVFEYNEKGQIVSETRKMPKGEDHLIQYTYENGLPIESTESNIAGEVTKINRFKYDKNPNPVKNLSISLNSMEMIFGYAIGNALHNVIAVETTYHLPGKWEKKNAGDVENKEYPYEYNEHGFPIAMPGDNDLKFSYICE